GFEPRKHSKKVCAAIVAPRMIVDRKRDHQISFGVWKDKIRRQHAYNAVTFSVQTKRVADYPSIAAKLSLPQPVGQYHHVLVARLVVIRAKRATQSRVYTEHLKCIRCYTNALKSLGRSHIGEVCAPVRIRGNVFKGAIAIAIVYKVGNAKEGLVEVSP